MKMRIVIACGGTGGHLFPGVAVAEELQRRGHETLLLVSQKQIDQTALAGRDDLKSKALPAIGWPGLFTPRLFTFFGKLWQTRSQIRQLFKEYQPGAVLGMGGFTSAVPLWEARQSGIPSYIHESNAIPGRVTRLFARLVDKVLVGFRRCAEALTQARCAVTGTPVRSSLRVIPRAEAAEKFGLDPNLKTLLITGGSQGARGVNRVVCETLPRWQDHRESWQFVHLTGEADEAEVVEAYKKQNFRVVVAAFSSKMAELYSLSDLVISRSGASSLTELSHYHLASILIPYPSAADDHQTANARIYEEAGAAVVHAQEGLTPDLLDKSVRHLLGDEEKLAGMKRAAGGLSVPDAAARVANEIEQAKV